MEKISFKNTIKNLLAKDHNLLFLAGLIGFFAGFASTVFRWMIDFGRTIFSNAGLSFIGIPEGIHWLLIPLMPMIGGLIIGAICKRFPESVDENGVHQVMYSVALQDGKIPKRTILSCATTSAITIGSGGSAGREGPTVQIGSAIGSVLGQLFDQSTERIRILVGCGAAAGIAASFNAPLAGVLFSLEIILRDFTIRTFSPIIISSVIGTVVGRALEGNEVTFNIPVHELTSYWETGFYLVLGPICGMMGLFFVKLYFYMHKVFKTKIKIPKHLKPALGGLIVGLISIIFPQVLGNGYGAMETALNGKMFWGLAFGLIFLKILVTSITLGSGGLGGVFAPSLFIGAMTGYSFGALVHGAFPSLTATPETYAVVGMGALAGAVMQAPLTNILMLFEMTNDYTLILPIMTTCILASYLMQVIHKHSIYFEKLLEKGINIHHGRELSVLNSILVQDVMDRNIVCIPHDTPFKRILQTISYSKNLCFPVTNNEGQMTGILSFSDVREMMLEEGLDNLVVANDLSTKKVIHLTPSKNLNEAMEVFAELDVEQVPVVQPNDPTKVIGMLTRGDVINVYNREVLVSSFNS